MQTDYDNHPETGETYKGISRVRHPKWAGWKYIDGVKALTTVQPHYGTEAYGHWRDYINKQLARLNQLQACVESMC